MRQIVPFRSTSSSGLGLNPASPDLAKLVRSAFPLLLKELVDNGLPLLRCGGRVRPYVDNSVASPIFFWCELPPRQLVRIKKAEMFDPAPVQAKPLFLLIVQPGPYEAYSGRSYGFPLAQVGDPPSLGRPRT
jgi:hypothetical protein